MNDLARELFYKRLGRLPSDFSIKRRRQDVVYDKKWFLFLKRVAVFRYMPFIRLVFGAGSMALKNVHKNSDFDVLICAKHGRIFTVRFLSIILTALLRIRRNKYRSSNCLCLNHFITLKSYKLSPPYDVSWMELYKNLVPIYGQKEAILNFLTQNNWAGEITYKNDLRHIYEGGNKFSIYLEKVLGGRVGDLLERVFKYLLLLKFYRFNNLPKSRRDRIIISDEEMELHLEARPRDEVIN
ncbi:MAG: hypothetical protein COV57_02170 [Candidatus Liptonbacteria bacterium CG11_big_fil_rev_8_21_14_0_20_35_14]|uniref:Polymerase nucleotidyl transferase domain-containing protein n=1 Tax=Candidatus Liptonbacteria bacterium CG11_big_fil_rev_8_21_14_0_20_35_14 TaxID=1974634 RepID=A0A2H0N7K4_9BACT|nr:MAG: hypothetical protein COV57_02170 [Candidatus Liptonbacteria bacterium CG11_big_fil_rev_8_21_14_0_20_35_14]